MCAWVFPWVISNNNLFSTARHGCNQKHDTEETVGTEDLGGAGDNSSQAGKILVDSNAERLTTKGTKNKGRVHWSKGHDAIV
jgi:hypothetical protein